ncbi:MAG TPA: CRISPR-associated endonuclease Cas2 [Acholeplasmataceae bacterium]|nr:CRISPR-associated endonuclease Cas2 [Acholeplasmataceae bacterium]
MIYEFMRLLLFFDLPNVTLKERKIYNDFRKYLISNGYIMIQFSVYSKLFNNKDAANNHIKILMRNAPKTGHIRLMLVTEKQYANTIIVVGGKTNQEKILTVDPFVLL